MAKKVTDYLNEVDYGDNDSYIPSQFALEFITFIKLVNGIEGEEHASPTMHYKMLDNLVKDPYGDVINLCHRGSAKTTLIAEYLFLYVAVYGELPGFGKLWLAIYVSDSIDNGVKSMRKNLEYRWESSEFLQKYIPTINFTDVRWEFTNVDGKRFIVKGYGAKSGIRGVKELGKRPQLAIMDDVISDEDANSATVIAKISDTLDKAITHAMMPVKRKIIWCGTPFNERDPLYKAVESGAWDVNVYPVAAEWPCLESEFRGSWAERFTFAYLKRLWDKAVLEGKVASFQQELMLRIMSDEDRLILDGDIGWYSLTFIKHTLNQLNIYITTDFATSAKSGADYSVIFVWGYTANGEWLWLDGVVAKQDMAKNLDDLFRLVQRYRPLSVGVEVSGQQGGFVTLIKERMARENNWFTLASENNRGMEGIRPVTNKMIRFNTVVPLFKTKKILFPIEYREDPRIVETVTELSMISVNAMKAKHDDCIDNISMLSVLNAFKPNAPTATHSDSNDVYYFGSEEDTDAGSSLKNYIY